MDTIARQVFIIGFLSAGIRIATPFLLAALGELVSEKAGLMIIGLEGMMLAGSLGGFLAAYYLNSNWIGLIGGMIAGILIALIFAFLSIHLCTDQVVNGIAVNIFSLGLTSLIYRSIFGISTIPPRIDPIGSVTVPFLSKIPLIGPILFEQSPLVYVAVLFTIVISYVIFRTNFGLSLQAVGENPLAADTAGINVKLIKYFAVCVAGALAGLGGSFLSVAQLGGFSENMTAGRGFIALAVVIFSRWNPYRAILASLIFGIAYALQLSLQALGFDAPYQFLLMLPYVLTMFTLAGFKNRQDAPAALGLPYKK